MRKSSSDSACNDEFSNRLYIIEILQIDFGKETPSLMSFNPQIKYDEFALKYQKHSSFCEKKLMRNNLS